MGDHGTASMRPPPSPIFILGVAPRSGTNFLWDLLRLHPDCAPGREPVREDFFVEYADLLLRFTDQVSARWDPLWGSIDHGLVAELRASLGAGLLDFLTVDRGRRLVVKSPSVRNVSLFFEVFPEASLIILVRDGRSIVQSCMATFGWDFDTATCRWAAAVDEILAFQGQHSPGRYQLVRYEDLLDDLERTLVSLFSFLRLDVQRFDFTAAHTLPVRGSSGYFGADRSAVHWDPVARAPEFDPRQRWRSWTPWQLERFSWRAAAQQCALAYDVSVPRPHGWRRARHRLADLSWAAARLFDRAIWTLRRRLGPRVRPARRRLDVLLSQPRRRNA
jgi:hypothetical protein